MVAVDETAGVPQVELDDSGKWLAGLSGPSRTLRDVLEVQNTLVARKAREMGIGPTGMRALRLLDIHGPLGPTELARMLDIRPASVTTLVDRLIDVGLLERVRSASDRRRVTIQATDHALQLSLHIWAPTIQTMDALGHALDPASRQIGIDYLGAVHQVLTHACAMPNSRSTGSGAEGN